MSAELHTPMVGACTGGSSRARPAGIPAGRWPGTSSGPASATRCAPVPRSRPRHRDAGPRPGNWPSHVIVIQFITLDGIVSDPDGSAQHSRPEDRAARVDRAYDPGGDCCHLCRLRRRWRSRRSEHAGAVWAVPRGALDPATTSRRQLPLVLVGQRVLGVLPGDAVGMAGCWSASGRRVLGARSRRRG
jgi:hypothetical protein